MESLEGVSVGIVGMARSGVGAARLVTERGGEAFVSDTRQANELVGAAARLEAMGATYETGGNTDAVFDGRDLVVVSPGVPTDAEILRRARSAGVPVIAEIELAYRFCRGDVVAVTGSNGKTTTTALAGAMFEAADRPVWATGNIGHAFSEVATEVPPDGVAVVECSSFQLEGIDRFHPAAAVVLNLSPDHLDRHGSVEAYAEAKARVFANQTHSDVSVLNADDQRYEFFRKKTRARVRTFAFESHVDDGATVKSGMIVVRGGDGEKPVCSAGEVRIPGPHNLANALAACVLSDSLGVPTEAMAEALRTFEGVPHRIETVAVIDGVRFVNDSKGTNVDSVTWALRSFSAPVVLIAGGLGKGQDFSPLRPFVEGTVVKLVLIGEAADALEETLGDLVPVVRAGTMDEAVRTAADGAEPGTTVLLSPACASFDMFDDFEHRGEVFRGAVRALEGRT
jgi:UDP-N-acetylmuramoylalanine--D-glutamate ligase